METLVSFGLLGAMSIYLYWRGDTLKKRAFKEKITFNQADTRCIANCITLTLVGIHLLIQVFEKESYNDEPLPMLCLALFWFYMIVGMVAGTKYYPKS